MLLKFVYTLSKTKSLPHAPSSSSNYLWHIFTPETYRGKHHKRIYIRRLWIDRLRRSCPRRKPRASLLCSRRFPSPFHRRSCCSERHCWNKKNTTSVSKDHEIHLFLQETRIDIKKNVQNFWYLQILLLCNFKGKSRRGKSKRNRPEKISSIYYVFIVKKI